MVDITFPAGLKDLQGLSYDKVVQVKKSLISNVYWLQSMQVIYMCVMDKCFFLQISLTLVFWGRMLGTGTISADGRSTDRAFSQQQLNKLGLTVQGLSAYDCGIRTSCIAQQVLGLRLWILGAAHYEKINVTDLFPCTSIDRAISLCCLARRYH